MISSTLCYSSPSAPTSCFFCIQATCLRPFLFFAAHDTFGFLISALLEIWIQTRSCPWEYLRRVCSVLSGLFSALDRFNRRHFHTGLVCCSPCKKMLLTNANFEIFLALSALRWISADKFRWFAIGMEPGSVFPQRNVDGRMSATISWASKSSPFRACNWH